MDIKKNLAGLCSLPGPSGFESAVSERCAALLSEFCGEVKIDRAGNVHGVREPGARPAKKLLLDAHMDEIGFIITGVEYGFLRFKTIGGVDPRMLVARELKIMTDPPLTGVICAAPPHLQTQDEMNRSLKVSEMYIDAGLCGGRAAETVPPGTPAVFLGGLTELSGGNVSGKAMDDRACVAVILRTLELLRDANLNVDLRVLFSVQEEVGCRGAKTGVFAAAPDYCVAVDVTHAHTPDSSRERTFSAGGGPAIGVGPNMTRRMSDALKSAAEALSIPYQIEVMEGSSGTNGWVMHVSREGIPTAVLSVPLKYMHTPVETVRLSDIEDTARLLAEFIRRFDGEGPIKND